jgi:hypothetical protein
MTWLGSPGDSLETACRAAGALLQHIRVFDRDLGNRAIEILG